MARADETAEGVAHDPGGDQRRDLRVVVRGRALDDLDAGEWLCGHQLDELEHLARQETAGFRPAGAGYERRVEAVDVEAQPDGFRAVPRHVQRSLRGGLDAHLHAVGHGHDRGAALAADLHSRTWRLPAADADLDEVARRYVRD